MIEYNLTDLKVAYKTYNFDELIKVESPQMLIMSKLTWDLLPDRDKSTRKTPLSEIIYLYKNISVAIDNSMKIGEVKLI